MPGGTENGRKPGRALAGALSLADVSGARGTTAGPPTGGQRMEIDDTVGSIDPSAGSVQPQPNDVAFDELILADVPRRPLRYAIDAVILTVLVFGGGIVMALVFGPTVQFREPGEVLRGRVTVDRGLALGNDLVSTAISGLYFVGSWTFLRGSPGMRLLGLRLGRDRDGTPVGVGSSLVSAKVLQEADWPELTRRAGAFVAAARQARSG